MFLLFIGSMDLAYETTSEMPDFVWISSSVVFALEFCIGGVTNLTIVFCYLKNISVRWWDIRQSVIWWSKILIIIGLTIYNVSGISGMGRLYKITDEHDICWNDNGIGWDSDQFHCLYSAWLENGKNCLWCFWILGYTWR